MATEREALMGQLLDAWLEDLRNDQEPRRPPAVLNLSAEDLVEVMRLARWYKAVLFPSAPTPDSVNGVAKRVVEQAIQERRAEADAVRRLVSQAATFADAVRAATTGLGIDLKNIEAACSLPTGTLARLLAGEVSPHRLPVDKMLAFFRGLRLPVRAVELLHDASVGWAHRTNTGAQTSLGRVDNGINDRERSELLASDDSEAALSKELGRIDAYCDDMRARLGSS